MKLSEGQKEIIANLLDSTLKYRETYEELYDHLVTTIEAMPESNQSVYDMAETILDKEFGGREALKQQEVDRLKTVRKAIMKKQWRYVGNHFKFPLIAFTVAFGVASYFLIDRYIDRKVLFLLVFAISLVPFLISAKRWYKQGLTRNKEKRSVKDGVMLSTSVFALNFLNVINFVPQLFVTNQDNYKVFNNAHASVVAVISVCYVVYTLSYIRLYREEAPMQMVSEA